MVKLLADLRERCHAEHAVVDDWGATTWAQLDERANRLIDLLRSRGVRPGDRVALLSGNRREIEEVYLACSHAGWHCVPVNWHLAASEVAYILEDSGANALIVASEYVGLAIGALTAAPHTVRAARFVFDDPTLEPVENTTAEIESYEAALSASASAELDDQMLGTVLFYTSGTTGRPNGVLNPNFELGRPPDALLHRAGSMEAMGIPPQGRTLLCGPHYHSAQWAFSYWPLVGGSRIVMQSRFVPEQLLNMVDVHRITNVHLVPTQFVRLLRVSEARRRAFDGSSLALVLHGAAPCAPDVKRAMIDWFGPIVSEYYGATEGGVVSMIGAQEWLDKPGSVGRPMPTVEVKIVDETGETAGPNTEGAVHTRSLAGADFEYLNAPDKTAAAHSEPGFMTMGDIGHLDEDGHLYLSARKVDVIISGGVNIYPAEIEAVIVTHSDVLDVAVIGVPDTEFGESVKAVVQLVDGLDWTDDVEAALIMLCRQRLAGFKCPRSFDHVIELPRNAAGKLQKRQIRAPYWEGTGRRI